jgi:serine protease Do
MTMKTALMIAIAALIAPAARGAGDGYADLVAKVQAAVVNIQTVQEVQPQRRSPLEQFFGAPQQRQAPEGSGTGFIVSADGYVVTNRHVVADAKEITVQTLDEKTYTGKVIGTDDSLDVALVKIDAEGLDFLSIGDSDKMRIGDEVLAMGFPLRLGFTVTTGIISGIGRDLNVFSLDVARYIQTDADITFGNSGGPLINTSGQVIAINTLIVSQGETYGFSIPSNLFLNAVDQLREYGRVKRGALGVGIADLDEEGRAFYDVANGARVTSVSEGLPAEKAGIQADDVILDINGEKINGANDVISVVSNKQPGDKVTLTVKRDGKTSKKTFALGDREKLYTNADSGREPEEDADISKDFGLGLTVLPLDDRTRRELGLDRQFTGVLIHDVDNSVTRRKGLVPGMIITEINRTPVDSIGDVRKILREVPSGEVVSPRVAGLSRGFQGTQINENTVFLRKK